MRRNQLKPLLEALEGRPTEREAVRLIAMYAVIPTTMVGLLASAIFVPHNAPEDRLWLYGISGAVLGAFTGLLGIMAFYRVFGFRAVAAATYGFLGALMGLAVGGWLTRYIKGASWLPLVTATVGGIMMLLLGDRKRPRRPSETDEPPEWKGP